jgi:glycolate oxidase
MNAMPTSKVIAEIARRLGAHKVQTSPEVLVCYAFDATNIRHLPAAVVYPDRREDVEVVMRLCAAEGVVAIPRGAGTGFAGGTVPIHGGVIVSTERMNRTISIDPERRQAVVQPGVVNADLQREAARVGLMFPPDPSSLEACTLGGNVAQDAGGPRALKYGVTRDYVLALEAVLYGGGVIASEAGVSFPGEWDPARPLLTGNEGTLAMVTKITLRLLRRPARFATALAFFVTTREAAAAVTLIFEKGVLPAAVELVDAETMACVASFIKIEMPPSVGCSLLVETDGKECEAMETMEVVEAALREAGSVEIRVAQSDEERDSLWRMRRAVSPSLARIAPWKINEDVCVPRSGLPRLVDAVTALGKKYGIRVPTFGHAGDGNLHVNVMFDPRKGDEARRAEMVVEGLFEATLELGGTISGEHGIGLTKLKFLPGQLGRDATDLETRIKQSFDPHGLLNPGKVFNQI